MTVSHSPSTMIGPDGETYINSLSLCTVHLFRFTPHGWRNPDDGGETEEPKHKRIPRFGWQVLTSGGFALSKKSEEKQKSEK